MSMNLQNIGGTCKIAILCAVIPRLYIRVRGANSLELLCSELNQVLEGNNNIQEKLRKIPFTPYPMIILNTNAFAQKKTHVFHIFRLDQPSLAPHKPPGPERLPRSLIAALLHSIQHGVTLAANLAKTGNHCGRERS